jgi:hypothetical protein
VAEVFAECGIGRIDFASRPTGGIITFEINTNPTILDEGDLSTSGAGGSRNRS